MRPVAIYARMERASTKTIKLKIRNESTYAQVKNDYSRNIKRQICFIKK